MPKITPEEVDLLAKYILTVSGITLDQSKGYLLENRLAHLLDVEGCGSYHALYQKAKSGSSDHLQKEIVDAITTNETFFFRDNTPFDLLKNKIIPDIIDRRIAGNPKETIPIKIWSAACSTGQEVYSIAITLIEMLPDRKKFDISIYGTDISDKAVAQASYGKYSKFEVERGLPADKRQRYFVSSGTDWRIRDEIRSLAKFEKLNLMMPFNKKEKFDVVFCRNVAIYFNKADKVKLFKKIAAVMKPDGALVVGGSENLSGIAHDVRSRQYLKGIYYELNSFSGRDKVKKATKPDRLKVGKSTPRPRRGKTVFDRPRKRVKPAKNKSVVINDSKKVEEELSTEQLLDVENRSDISTLEGRLPASLAEKISGQQEESTKSSLLSSVQNTKKSNSFLDARQAKSGTSKGSLLEKISRQNAED